MKKLTKKKLKMVKGGTASLVRCQDDTDCPTYCTNEPGGPHIGYVCGWNANCQRVVCPGP